MSQSYGAIARFDGPAELIDAARKARAAGYRRLDAHSPFPIHGIDEAMGLARSPLPWLVLVGGATGLATGFLLQWYPSVVEYPLIVGGKPFNSIEAWVPIAFELTILFAAFAAVFGMLLLNGLPRLHHPAFDATDFARATDDGFFLAIEAGDPSFSDASVIAFLGAIGGKNAQILEG